MEPAEWIPIAEAAQVAGCSTHTLVRRIEAGTVAGEKRGHRGRAAWYVRRDSLPGTREPPEARPAESDASPVIAATENEEDAGPAKDLRSALRPRLAQAKARQAAAVELLQQWELPAAVSVLLGDVIHLLDEMDGALAAAERDRG